MGVKNLLKLIKEFSPKAIREVPVRELSGWKIGIDASIFIYQWASIGIMYGIKGNNNDVNSQDADNKSGKSNTTTIHHLGGIVSRTCKMIALNIIPVYIFDGKPPKIKAGVIADRKELKSAGKSVKLNSEIFKESVELLRLMKIPLVQAPSEAEAQAAIMTKVTLAEVGNHGTNTIIDAVATNDIDAIVFGARYMICGLDSGTLTKKSATVTLIDRDEVLRGLGLTHGQLVDLAILLGSDYTESTLKNASGRAYSYKKLYELIKKHGSIEKILSIEQIIPPPKFTFLEARREFLSPYVEVASSLFAKFSLSIHKLTPDELLRVNGYLRDHGVPEEKAEKMTKTVGEIHNILV